MNHIDKIAGKLYQIINEFRRNPNNLEYDGTPIIEKIKDIINQSLPLKIILPAFHGKSNNRDFVISHLPDYGEYLGIKTLTQLYDKLSTVYPQVEILILHEGHFHADVELFGNDNDVKAYMIEFRKLISPYGYMKSYCINELILEGATFDEKRNYFLNYYCPTLQNVEELIKSGGRLKSLYLAYKKLYQEKIADLGKSTLSCKQLRDFSKDRSLLQLRKYIGFAKLIQIMFANDKFIKLSWVYKDNSVTDQISIKVLGNDTQLGTPGFFSVVQDSNGKIDFITKKQAVENGFLLKTYNKLPYYAAI